MKKSKKIIKSCKKHGETEHRIYVYKKNNKNIICICCMECVRENRRNRYKDPIKRAHDIEYTKNWSNENKDHLNEMARKKLKEERDIKNTEVNAFLKRENKKIQKLFDIIQPKISKRQFNKHCCNFHITSLTDVKNFLLSNKRSELNNLIQWKQSTLSKYHYFNKLSEVQKAEINEEINKRKTNENLSSKKIFGLISNVRTNYYKNLTEEQKAEIRAEYHKNTNEIVNKKMEEILQKI